MLDIDNYLRDSKILKKLVKKPSATDQITNRLFTKVAKPNQTVLADGDLRAIIKPEKGHMHKNRPSI